MSSLPLLHLIFFLATLFQPADTTKFTVTLEGKKVTWTQQADGWHGDAENGHDIGVWSASGQVVSVTEKGAVAAAKTDLAKLVKVEGGEGAPRKEKQQTQVSVSGRPVTVAADEKGSTLTFSQKGGVFARPFTVEYTTK